ncbi:uncharacterized protein LOC123299084 [Chrysoperla carnea]|uniref:uncharacterized protein LOC123299084 n=1 Tax=Chrysoperla carnea TaxID=189513 RepID=UPI001D06FEED|nr:uncharacterized protein LOC123299084 [Chrysoperla carnea]
MKLFIVVLIIVTVKGEYITFNGHCPSLSPPEDLEIDLNGKYYTIAVSLNGTTRNDIVNQFEVISPDEFHNSLLFRSAHDDDACRNISVTFKVFEMGIYTVVHQDGRDDSYVGNSLYFLSDNVAFLCRDTSGEEVFRAEIAVLSKEIEEFDSDQRDDVEEVLTSYGLDFMNQYISPVKQCNPCL